MGSTQPATKQPEQKRNADVFTTPQGEPISREPRASGTAKVKKHTTAQLNDHLLKGNTIMIPEVGRAEVADACTLVKLFREGRREDIIAFLDAYDEDEKTTLILTLLGVAAALAIRPEDMTINHFLDLLPDQT